MNGPFKFYANPADCPAAGCMGGGADAWGMTEPAAAHGGYAADGGYGQQGGYGQHGAAGQNGAYAQQGAHGAHDGYHATDAGGFGGVGPSQEPVAEPQGAHGMGMPEEMPAHGKPKKGQKLKVSQRKRVGCC